MVCVMATHNPYMPLNITTLTIIKGAYVRAIAICFVPDDQKRPSEVKIGRTYIRLRYVARVFCYHGSSSDKPQRGSRAPASILGGHGCRLSKRGCP